MDYLRYAVVVVLISIAILRNVDLTPQPDATEGEQAIAGVLYELSTLELPTIQQYDVIRAKALESLRGDESLRFSPPEWFVDAMKKLNDATVSEARVGFENASVRLFGRQSGSTYDSGRKAVRMALRPSDDERGGKCEDCDGTGKVGDGRVYTTCLTCNGDGVIDDSDRKEEGQEIGTSNKERSGDQISRGPACVNAGGRGGGTGSRVAFPALRRLLGR